MKKIAFIVQRYGIEINGGAEQHCRLLAKHLASQHDITILTSCASDYITWLPTFDAGESVVEGIKVLRFQNKEEKDKNRERYWRKILLGRFRLIRELKFKRLFFSFFKKWNDGDVWLQSQGPYCEDLITYLQNNHSQFDILIFMTYLYYPTVVGMRVAPEKSILIPTAHNERPIYFTPFKPFFQLPAFIMYNMNTERRFVQKLFHNEQIPNDIAGIGIEAISNVQKGFKQSVGIEDDFVLYVGRLDGNKGIPELLRFFTKYKKEHSNNLKLVLIGQAFMPIPSHPDIISLGFVSEEVRNSAMSEALLFVLPSRFESLSMVVLESLSFKVPVLVSGYCEVLVEHCNRSKAGFFYKKYSEFASHIEFALNNKDALKEMGQAGYNYVINNYNWNVIVEKFNKAFEVIDQKRM